MKVAVVSCVYPPEPVVSSRTSADIAAALRDGGEQVSVICPFPSRPEGRIYDGFRRTWRKRTIVEGIDTIRCYSTVSPRSTLVSRFAENISFGISSALALLRIRRPDVVFLNSWPIFATGSAAAVARMRRVPYVISVQDVYPESLIVQQRAGSRLLAAVLRRLDGRIARGAAAVIVLSESFARIYREDRGVDPSKIHVIPNWSSEPPLATRDEALAYRRSLGVRDEDFLVVYGGNIGVAAGVEQLIEAFRHIDRPDVRLLIAGAGARADACEEAAKAIPGNRIHFQRPWPPEKTAVVLAAADLLALPTTGEQSQISVPSKLVSYLLAERPVLALVGDTTETARIVRESGAGWIVSGGGGERLAAAIVQAAAASNRDRASMGAGGRAYARAHFGREGCVSRVIDIVRSAAR